MIKIIINGINGKMGKAILKNIKNNSNFELGFGIQRKVSDLNALPIYNDIFEAKELGDVIVDYSNPDCLDYLLKFALQKKIPLIIATTGFNEIQKAQITEASKYLPILFSSNMSLGISALLRALSVISPILKDDYEIEIIEKHHSKKIDSPSGTSIMLRDRILQSSAIKREIKIHSLRSGTNPGEHSIIFSGKDEIIELKHQSYSRDLFAEGTLKAANWIINQAPGLYSMEDIN
jgi:4-hydroxy-tetrahydrodipicolinate reductase